MVRLTSSFPLGLALGALALSPSFGTAASIQSSNVKADQTRADAVKESFQKSYEAYKQYCFGRDQLKPLSKTCEDPLGGWGATLVDVQSTAFIMGLTDVYNETVAKSLTTDYTKTSADEVSIFETTIRHVAGLLASYELGGKKEAGLVRQAEVVAQKLLHGWVGNNNIPFNTLRNWTIGPIPKTDGGAGIAEAGTLIIEMDRLSKYSGNSTYLKYAAKSMKAVINSTPLPFPFLNPQCVDPNTGKTTCDYITWGGGSDSFFEYEVKYALLTASKDTYFPAWIGAVNSSIAHLLTTASGTVKQNLTYLADYSASSGGLIPRGSHLECFVAGNWILGGKELGNNDIFQYGLDLAESCINTYLSTATGIGPESFVFKSANGSTNGVNITNEAFYEANGFDIDGADYVLRPEVLESVFYAYRTTGDQYWQDVAWKAFQSILKYCGTSTALASLDDVNDANTKQWDISESFLYAELYKYLFLIFSPADVISIDKYVFNTEAHPFLKDDANADFTSLNPGNRLAKPMATSTRGSPPPTRVGVPQTSGSSPARVPLPHYSSNPLAQKLKEGIWDKLMGL